MSLTTFDATKARSRQPTHKQLTVHWLLDASSSMLPYTSDLVEAVDHYRAFLARVAPLGQGQLCTFADTVHLGPLQPLHHTASVQDYAPCGNTALYDAIYDVTVQPAAPGQHILVIVSDGRDTVSSHDCDEARTGLTMCQEEDAWTVVFLGAFDDALEVAKSLGIPPGNALVFPGRAMPEAFRALEYATQALLNRIDHEQRLIPSHTFFQEGL